MAVAIESSASTSETSTASLTITKPSGLAEGDHLVALIFERSGGTPQTPSGWTSKNTPYCEPNSNLTCRIVTKLADGTDVAASNFSFPSSDDTSRNMRGLLLRVSGLSTDLQFASSYSRVSNSGIPTYSLSTTPFSAGSLTLAIITNNYVATLSDVIVSPDDPTWTEYLDNDTVTIYGAVRAASTEITSMEPTGTFSNMSLVDTVGYVATIAASVDASGGNSLLSSSTTVFTQNGVSNASGDSTFLSTTTTVNSQSGTTTSPTQWTNESNPSTTWTNET